MGEIATPPQDEIGAAYQRTMDVLAGIRGVTQEMVDTLDAVNRHRQRLAEHLQSERNAVEMYRRMWLDARPTPRATSSEPLIGSIDEIPF